MHLRRRSLIFILAGCFLAGVPAVALANDSKQPTTGDNSTVTPAKAAMAEWRTEFAQLQTECRPNVLFAETSGVAEQRKALKECKDRRRELRSKHKELVKAKVAEQKKAEEDKRLAEQRAKEEQRAAEEAKRKAEEAKRKAAEEAKRKAAAEAAKKAAAAEAAKKAAATTTLSKTIAELDAKIAAKRQAMAQMEQCAREYTALAATLEGEAREYKLEKAAYCTAQAAAYAQRIKELEAERARLLSGKTETATLRAKYESQLKSVNDTIVYKKSLIADAQASIAENQAKLESLTGTEREKALAEIAEKQEQIAYYTNYLKDLEAQRAALLAKLASLT
jgi:hypothetical protein